MKKIWMLTCLVPLLLASCQSGAKEEKIEIPSDWQTFEGANYSVKCPASWRLDTAQTEGVVFKLLSPADDSIQDRFNEYVKLSVMDVEKNMSLKELAYSMEQGMDMSVANLDVSENKLFKDEQGQFQILRGTGSLSIFIVTLENRTRIINQKGYALLGIYEDSKSSAYKKTMLGIMQSVVIK